MTNKLYEAHTEINFYIVAKDSDSAKDLARKHLRDEADNVCFTDIDIIKDPPHIWGGFDNSYPYGDDEGKTVPQWHEIREAIRKKEAEERYQKLQHNLFPETATT